MAQSNTLQASDASNNSPPNYGYSSGMDQVSSGPAALLYTLSNQLIAIYSELQALFNKITQAETNVQKSTIIAGADAQRKAAANQAIAGYAQAAGSATGGLITLGTTVLASRQNAGLDNQLTQEKSQLSELNGLNKISQDASIERQNLIVGNEDLQPSQEVETRKDELNVGMYRSEQPLGQEIDMEALNKDAIRSMTPQELKDFRTTLQMKISDQTRAINDISNSMQTAMTQYNSYGQLGSGVANGAAQALQANYTAKAGENQAAQQINQGVSQMASTTAETTKQNLGKYYDSVAGLIAAARQGAQAYAQT